MNQSLVIFAAGPPKLYQWVRAPLLSTLKDLTEAEEIKKRWQEHTEELYKKDLMTQITTMVWSLT